MKDIGEAKYVLGVEIIQRHPKKHASKYLGMILDTPVANGLTLSLVKIPKTNDEIDNVPYVSVIGS